MTDQQQREMEELRSYIREIDRVVPELSDEDDFSEAAQAQRIGAWLSELLALKEQKAPDDQKECLCRETAQTQ